METSWPRATGFVPAALGTLGVLATVVLQVHERSGAEPDGRALVLGLLAVLGLLVQVRRPLVGLAVVVAAMTTYTWLDFPGGPVYLSLPLALFVLALAVPWQAAAAAGMTGAVLLCLSVGIGGEEPLPARAAGFTAWTAVALLAAQVVKGRRERAAEARRRVLDQQQRTRTEERVRIAQDLHDGIGHALSVISIQARVARRHVHDHIAAEALDVVIGTTAGALNDVQLVLERLRDDQAPLRPRRTLDDLEEVVAAARRAGQAVDLDHQIGRDVPLPVQSAIVLIVQEALTNARRHAPGEPVGITLCGTESLRLRVVNRVTSGSVSHGLGIVGMVERARGTGGELRAGPCGERWEVEASWPL